jgi:predicted MFS family arabinose efflux permease
MSRVWRTWLALMLFAIGTSLITPLIPIYKARLGFSDTVVTLFLVCYVIALVPSMLTLGQLSDRVGRKGVLIGALVTLGVAQVYLATEPPLSGLLVSRGLQGLATGAFFGTCTAFLVDAAPATERVWVAVLASVSVRAGLGLGPGLGGLFAQYVPDPLRAPFLFHLCAIAVAIALIATLPETVTTRSRRPLTLRLEVPAADRRVFWRVLVPSGMLFSLFDGVCLSLIPVFEVRELGVTNYALVGAAGFLVLVSGAVTQIVFRFMQPTPAITWGLAVASVAFVGVVIGAPTKSAALVLASVAVTGGACGLVFKGGVDLATRIAPPSDRGKLISSYYVACYLGGFSLPLLIIGVSADLIGLTGALTILTVAAATASAWTVKVGLQSVAALPSVEAVPAE